MAHRSDHSQTLARLQLMYQDARRSVELREQESDTIRRRVITVRGGYRSAARTTLQATLAEQAAHKRLAAQTEQNLAGLAQCVDESNAQAGGHLNISARKGT